MSTQDFKRKLTAILSADVEGYSRLMGEDEDGTVRTLTAYRELISNLIQKHRGRVVDSPGDNLLAEFGSVMDAVRCAVEIQEELRIRNAELPENRKMQFRIGINLGDVIEEGGRIYGDGINVAARVEGLAEGGGICISGGVYDAIRNKLSMTYDSLGEHSVKNIKEPVRVYRIRMEPEGVTEIVEKKKGRLITWQRAALAVMVIIILGAVAIWYFSFRQAPVVKDVKEGPKTIAVIPFVNLSSDPEQEYFVDGLSEEMLNSLSQIKDLRVTARTSSFAFKGTNKKVQEIANELGVAHILEGSVRKAGNALRITAQLVRATDGFHLFSKTYDRELKDIFVVQEDIATAVADELKVTLGIGKPLKQLGGTDNLEAYELYLVAKGHNGKMEYNRALESIDASIALDPGFALAWILKAAIHRNFVIFGPKSRADSELDAALSAAQKTIEIEPNLAEGYIALSRYEAMRGNWVNTELNFRKALQLQTGTLSQVLYQMSGTYNAIGYFKKSREILEESMRNDPLNESARRSYVLILGLLGDMQGVENENERCKALFGDEWKALDMGSAYYRLGTGDPVSRDEIEYSSIIFNTAKEYLDSPKEGLAKLHQLYSDENNLSEIDITDISMWAAYFGDSEFAMDAMEKGVRINATGFFKIWYPVMKEVRKLPRFKEFIKEIGLVDYWNKFGWPDNNICRPVGDDDFKCD